MRFADKHRGVISVFLSLILLPCFLFSSIVIDGARVYSSVTFMNGVGDLTMNTALSDFDLIVKDVYGLMAMSDTPEEMSENLEAYLLDMIERKAGFDAEQDEYTKRYIQEICGLFKGYDTVDFENIVNIQLENLESYGIPSSTLANPEVLENQIVEYMKYRGPVTILGQGLFEKFSQFKGMTKQITATEEETKYQEEFADLGESLENCYLFLKEYIEESRIANSSLNMLVNKELYQSDIDAMQDDLKWMLFYTVAAASPDLLPENLTCWDAGATDDTGVYLIQKQLNDCIDQWAPEWTAPDGKAFQVDAATGKIEIPEEDPEEPDEDSEEEDASDEDGNEEGADSGQEIKEGTYYEDFLEDLALWLDIEGFLTTGKKLNVTGGSFYNFNTEYEGYTNPEDMLNKALCYQRFMTQEENREKLYLLSAFVNVYKKYESLRSDQKDTEKKAELKNYYTYVARYAEYDKTQGKYGIYQEENVRQTFQSLPDVLQEQILHYIREAAGKAEFSERARDAQLYLQGAQEWMKKVKSDLVDLQKQKDVWENAVNDLDDGEVKTTFTARFNETTQEIEEESITELESVIAAYDTFLGSVLDQYGGLKVVGDSKTVPIINRSWYEEIGKLVYNVADLLKVPSEECSVVTYADGFASRPYAILRMIMNKCAVPRQAAQDIVDAYKTNYNAPSLSQGLGQGIEAFSKEAIDQYVANATALLRYPDFSVVSVSENDVNTTRLYKQMEEWFAQEDKPKESDQKVKDAESGADKLLNATKDTSQNYTADTSDRSGEINQVLESFNEPLSGNNGLGTVSAGGISKGSGKNKTDQYKGTSSNAKGLLNSVKTLLTKLGNILESERDILYVATYALENFSCATTNLEDGKEVEADKQETTLSGYAIDPYNNYCYQRELEYILWGSSNLNENIGKTKALVYGIRFALNTVYAFSSPELQSMTNQAATLISCGVVFLQPIINVVLVLALSAAESALDLNELMKGNDVVLYKNAKSWHMSVSGMINYAVNEGTEMVASYAMDAAGNIITNVFDRIETVSTDKIDELETIGDDYIKNTEANIKKTVTDTVVTPLINKLYSFASNIRVSEAIDQVQKRLQTEIDGVFDSLEQTIQAGGDTPIVKAEQAALAYLRENTNSLLIDPMMDYLEQAKNATDATARVEQLANKIQSIVNEVTDKIGDKVSGVLEEASTKLKSTIKEACDKAEEEAKKNVDKAVEKAADGAKKKVNQAVTDYMGELSGVKADGDGGLDSLTLSQNAGQSTSFASTFTLNYKEYLTAFVIIGLQPEGNRNAMLQRMAVLIQMNLTKEKEGAEEDPQRAIPKAPEFRMANAYTMVELYAKYHVNTLFLNATYEGELDFAKMGQTNGVDLIYQSVMGY